MVFPRFIIDLGLTLLGWAEDVWSFVGMEFTVGGSTWAVYELIFGGGIIAVLTYIIISWIANIIS